MHVEIWSDIACPWCYVGKRRFEAALAEYEGRDDVQVTWRSFELDPHAPQERPVDAATHLAQKYGRTREEALEMQARMTETAAAEGLDFRLDLVRGGNTFDGHRLLHLALADGSQDALKERLLRGYLCEGEPIGDPAALERLSLDVGLPRDAVQEVLSGERYAAEVREDERTAAKLGISAVPFFVVNRSLAVSGAQPPAALAKLLRTGSARSAVAVGESCGVDGC
jgi:predicted DsbA family dithiol-disulfide isomerase